MPFFLLHMLLHFKRSKYTQIWLLTWMFAAIAIFFLYCTLQLTWTQKSWIFPFEKFYSYKIHQLNPWLSFKMLGVFKAVFFYKKRTTHSPICLCHVNLHNLWYVFSRSFFGVHFEPCFFAMILEIFLNDPFTQLHYSWDLCSWCDNTSRRVSQSLQKRVISELINS